jgi:hypothetical protein
MAQSVGSDFNLQCQQTNNWKKKNNQKMQSFENYKSGQQKFVGMLRELGDLQYKSIRS